MIIFERYLPIVSLKITVHRLSFLASLAITFIRKSFLPKVLPVKYVINIKYIFRAIYNIMSYTEKLYTTGTVRKISPADIFIIKNGSFITNNIIPTIIKSIIYAASLTPNPANTTFFELRLCIIHQHPIS